MLEGSFLTEFFTVVSSEMNADGSWDVVVNYNGPYIVYCTACEI